MTQILWDKAGENADAARPLLRNELYNVACTRAYYAMFTAARALLKEQCGINLDAVKRHTTVLQMFSLNFVKTGSVDKDLGQAFSLASRLRGIADYTEMAASADEAGELLGFMEKFLARLEELRHSGKPP